MPIVLKRGHCAIDCFNRLFRFDRLNFLKGFYRATFETYPKAHDARAKTCYRLAALRRAWFDIPSGFLPAGRNNQV